MLAPDGWGKAPGGHPHGFVSFRARRRRRVAGVHSCAASLLSHSACWAAIWAPNRPCRRVFDQHRPPDPPQSNIIIYNTVSDFGSSCTLPPQLVSAHTVSPKGKGFVCTVSAPNGRLMAPTL